MKSFNFITRIATNEVQDGYRTAGVLLEPIWGNADELVAVYDQIFALEDVVCDFLARPQGLIRLSHGFEENQVMFPEHRGGEFQPL